VLSDASQVAWREQILAAYEQRYGKTMPQSQRVPPSPRQDTRSARGTAIGRVKLASSGTLPVYTEGIPRVAAEEKAPDLKPVPVVSIGARDAETESAAASASQDRPDVASVSVPQARRDQASDAVPGEPGGGTSAEQQAEGSRPQRDPAREPS